MCVGLLMFLLAVTCCGDALLMPASLVLQLALGWVLLIALVLLQWLYGWLLTSLRG